MELEELITRIQKWKSRMESGGAALQAPAATAQAAPRAEALPEAAEEVSDGMLMSEEEPK